MEHTDLTPWHCLPKEITVHILRDRILACENTLGEAGRRINIACEKEFRKCHRNNYLDELNKNML